MFSAVRSEVTVLYEGICILPPNADSLLTICPVVVVDVETRGIESLPLSDQIVGREKKNKKSIKDTLARASRRRHPLSHQPVTAVKKSDKMMTKALKKHLMMA